MIEGRKGGGARTPVEAPNTLRSTQIAEIVVLLSEGEAQGLVNGLRSVYADQVPIETASGSRNFEGVTFAYVQGTQGQPALHGLTAVQREISVAVQVDQATPIVRTINDVSIDHVRVTISVPSLTEQDMGSGDLGGSAFEWAIDVQASGAGYVERHRETVRGKTTSSYSRAVRVQLAGVPPWDVRVRRISADPAGAHVVNRFSWSSYTEISTVKLRYPNSAVALLRVDARAFSRLPTIAFDWLGQRIEVPVNYDPIARTYEGAWDGTFKVAWSNNPAWVLHDLLTHPRYGLGAFCPAELADKWGLYAIAQYCDQPVPDGRGGVEPRFVCNLVLQTRAEAFDVLQDLAAIFRGMVFWAPAAINFAQDAPSDATLLYTPANVVEGLITYADFSELAKHSVWVVWWNDLAHFGQQVPEVYMDEELVARYGLRELELQPLGLTSRGQAARVCRWARHSEQLESETVTFTVGSDGIAVAPGSIFRIADPNEAGERLGGRIEAATPMTVTLDAAVTLGAGETYTLSVLLPDHQAATKLRTESRTIISPAGTAQTLSVAVAFSQAPRAGTVWVLEGSAAAPTTWRCIAVEEVDGRYRITGVAHDPRKYAAIEEGLKLDTLPISRLTLMPPKPVSISLTETVYQSGTRSKVTVSWPAPSPGLRYVVAWRHNATAWRTEETDANSIDVHDLPAGSFEVEVRSANALGNVSPATTGRLVLAGT